MNKNEHLADCASKKLCPGGNCIKETQHLSPCYPCDCQENKCPNYGFKPCKLTHCDAKCNSPKPDWMERLKKLQYDHFQPCQQKLHDGTCDISRDLTEYDAELLSFISELLASQREMIIKEIEDGLPKEYGWTGYRELPDCSEEEAGWDKLHYRINSLLTKLKKGE